ncbi:MAG: Sigma-70 region 2, partial [Acidimicrobiaceae bacterium]|nr:Sigma-70 region 2 [Acidimicrobiaceae bacterium]
MTALSIAVPARPRPDDDGDYSAFYRRYERPLVCYLRMGFRAADVEAVAQETFCRALTHWSEVGRMSNPWPWLAVTARNLARNNIRDE